MGLWGKIHKVVVRDLWRKVRLEATKQARGYTNRRMCFEQAKVFEAHAVLHGLCANLINALKLLMSKKMEMVSYRIL